MEFALRGSSMDKKILVGMALGLTIMASSCFAQVIEKVEVYKNNELKIPQVVGINSKAAKKINDYIVKNVASDPKKFIDKHGPEGATGWLYSTVVRDDDKYLSLRIASASYFKGAAHPNAYIFGLVFDKATGKKLPIEHFVKMMPAEQLEYCVRNKVFGFYAYGDEPLELEKSLHITHVSEQYTLDNNDNLDIYYQQYELGPYAIGAPYVRLGKSYVDNNGHVLPKG